MASKGGKPSAFGVILAPMWGFLWFGCIILAALSSPLPAQLSPARLSHSSVPRAKELELLAQLPLVPQEMRGAWLATVHNIDWPSVPGGSPSEQQAELLEMLERAQKLGLNTILFQVRDVADAFYPSELEPWSAFLTGHQGRDPGWDPLAFAIAESHKRGLELHAWLNPYRVGYLKQNRFDPGHIFRQRPDLVRLYDDSYWLDPGNPDSEAHILSVVEDIVSRYRDLDGLHYDDYFYPYPKAGLLFRDNVTQKAYAGIEDPDNWRRENIDRLIFKTYRLIKEINPYLSFGVSPFGIWRNDQPRGVRGLESYHELFADSRKWLRQGWVDYMAPQFYWAPDAPRQPFGEMLDWWIEQNIQGRHVITGINVADLRTSGNVNFREILKKVTLRREYRADGEIYYSLGKINTPEWQANVRSLYPYQALPALVGPKRPPLPAPRINITLDSSNAVKQPVADTASGNGVSPVWQLSWGAQAVREPNRLKYWVLYYLREGIWNYRIYPAWVEGIKINGTNGRRRLDPRYFAVAAVDRGNAVGNIAWFASVPVEDIASSRTIVFDLPRQTDRSSGHQTVE